MFFPTLRIYKNVINENNDKFVQLWHEVRVHEIHEMCGRFYNPNDMTRYSKRLYLVVKAIFSISLAQILIW
jgi:hypothetical protein